MQSKNVTNIMRDPPLQIFFLGKIIVLLKTPSFWQLLLNLQAFLDLHLLLKNTNKKSSTFFSNYIDNIYIMCASSCESSISTMLLLKYHLETEAT